MIRTAFLVSCLCATPAMAQTIDVIAMPDGADVTITLNADTGQQDMMFGDEVLLSAPTLTRDLSITDVDGNPAGAVVFADSAELGCAPAPYVVSLQFGMPWPQGPLGVQCAPYFATVRPGTVVLTSAPDLAQPGDVIAFDLRQGLIQLGALAYTPQPGRGWDALDGEVGGYSDLSSLDLYAAEPVFNALTEQWNDQLFIYAQHLRTRSIPFVDGNFLLQSGCVPGQCEFAIGLLAVDPGNERVYSAFFNEGAPDFRPALEAWSEPARALYDRWRSGEFQ